MWYKPGDSHDITIEKNRMYMYITLGLGMSI